MGRVSPEEPIFWKGLQLSEFEHISQREMARILDVTQATINRWKTGLQEPGFGEAVRVMETIGIPLETFYSEKLVLDSAERIKRRFRNRRGRELAKARTQAKTEKAKGLPGGSGGA